MSETIAGRYELGERLGFGGMSTVHLAFDRRLERQVAVKLLAEHLADDPQFVSRFRREALAAARLVHPNIVQVFDFGLDDPSGRHFIVMEYIKGQSGAELLRDHGRLSLRDGLFIVEQSCRGLEHAHRHGVVHRDVKPGNLLRSDEGPVKLADFGIAKASADAGSRITQVGSVLGTAAYLSPEQAAGEEATPRSDLYSLGVVAYQFLAGRLPYEAQSLTELALKQQREYPPMLDEIDPSVPHGVAQAVARALEMDPRDRFGSATEMREALAAGASGQTFDETDATSVLASDPTTATRMLGQTTAQPAPARRLQPTPGPATGTPYQPAGIAPPPAAPKKSRRGAITATLLLLAAIVAVVAYLALSSSGGGGADVQPVTGSSSSELVQSMKELVDENTR
ncbi:MAG TPA: protein kinase [Solirubrobacteraceae bacterium]|nr:protein kinase [Solirubrobacteraceae bacterium]